MYSLNCNGRLLSWNEPIVMGVLNMTPDSFYSGSRIRSEEMLLNQAEKMLAEGASILDLGGLSSRPGALEISADAELDVWYRRSSYWPPIFLALLFRLTVTVIKWRKRLWKQAPPSSMILELVKTRQWQNSRPRNMFHISACICVAIREPCRI